MNRELLVSVFCLVIRIASAQELDGPAIIKHLETNVYSSDMTFKIKMDIYKGDDLKRTYLMDGFKQGEKFRIEFIEPEIERGRRLLNDSKSLWMYLPLSSKIIRLSSKQSFLGSDASNSDVLRVSISKDYDVVSVTNHDEFIELKLAAKDLEISYYRINIFLQKETLVPIRQEFLSLSEKIIRTIVYSDYKKIDGLLFPMTSTIKDELKKDSKTIITYKSLSRKCDKPEFFYTTTSLRK